MCVERIIGDWLCLKRANSLAWMWQMAVRYGKATL